MDPMAREAMRATGRVSALGIEFGGAVIGALLAGRWLDGKLGTGPWLAVVGILFGSAAGFLAVYRTAKAMQKQAEADEARERRGDDGEG